MTSRSPLTQRDAAELALGCLSRILDSSRVETHALYLAADYLRKAGLDDMAGAVKEAAGRCSGSDADVQDVYGRLWAMLDARRPMPVESRRAA